MENNKGVELNLSEKEVENLILKALSNDDIKQYVKKLNVPNFRNVYLNLKELPKKIRKNECGIVNLFFHWVCYFKNENQIYYFDSMGEDAPIELKNYFNNRPIVNTKKLQKKGDPAICGYLCIIVLYLLEVKKMKWEDVIKTIGMNYIKNFFYTI